MLLKRLSIGLRPLWTHPRPRQAPHPARPFKVSLFTLACVGSASVAAWLVIPFPRVHLDGGHIHAHNPSTKNGGWFLWRSSKDANSDVACTHCGSNPDVDRHNFIAEAADIVLESVVNITVETEVPDLFNKRTLVSRGSGFFITRDGKILTNAHVVEDYTSGSKILVTTSDGREYEAYIHAVDFLSDLAILSIVPDSTDLDPVWKAVRLGSSREMRAGEWVVSIGNPLGLANTVTAGIISSHRRKNTDIGRSDSRVEYLQTDCVIHPGSSGGPLVNLRGEVVGINTVRADSEGISFAIKVDHCLDMIAQLLSMGRIVRPWLGVGLVSLNPFVWQQLRSHSPPELRPRVKAGVLVTGITPESPAARAGCREGDVIVEIEGRRVESASKLLKLLGLQIDKPVRLLIKRNEVDGRGEFKSVDIHVIIQPEEFPV
ncbi:trypsin-like cysteine/serine peptidase domain-containing protein [Chytriomyces sp. MP71]|nr:trypsin-like cysteine/serine peptidase domain-containing protein [Chytriomyces sp. MP71]